MLQFILTLLAPSEKLPPGGSDYSLSSEGLSPGWAFFLLVICIIAIAWSYRRYAKKLSWPVRVALIVLRSLVFALAIMILVRPVLVISLRDSIRRPLLVLLDVSQSMGIADRRAALDDITRAALAKGLIRPDGGLQQSLTGQSLDDLRQIPRSKLLELLAANPQLNLWPNLQAKSDLIFYGLGRKLSELGKLEGSAGPTLTTAESAAFFHNRAYDENLTAIGDALIDLLNQQRGQPNAGILLITDGGNNSGTSPLEAANIAREDHVPLFIYGVGITTPQDVVVTELDGPATSNLKERVNFTVHARSQGMAGKKTTVTLKANGKVVDTEPVEFHADGEQDLTVGYEPQEVGDVQLEATVVPLPEEAVQDNNTALAVHHVVDDKISVLLVEKEPRWDDAFLIKMLQRDRRIKAKTFFTLGDGSIDPASDETFIEAFPDDQAALNKFDVVILGDVDPNDLGPTHLKLLSDWVGKFGGGLIFLAGPRYNPNGYADTPLEPLLPVELMPGSAATDYPSPVPLNLTVAGETSPLLSLVQNPEDNSNLWDKFPGVRWTAWVGRARPGAQVLLTDPSPERATNDGPMPVIAQQGYGLGETIYIGEQETYRWRSTLGEKYYTQIYGQILQALASQHLLGGTGLTQLKTDKVHYMTGDRVHISGRLFKVGREPLTDTDVVGQLVLKQGQGKPIDVRLYSVPDRVGEYQGEVTVPNAGAYKYFTARDPSVSVSFDVSEPKVELSDIAMKEKVLKAMATASNGHYLREEDLYKLPAMVTAQSAISVSTKKIPLSCAPLLFAVMLLIACAEWLWRRKLQLK